MASATCSYPASKFLTQSTSHTQKLHHPQWQYIPTKVSMKKKQRPIMVKCGVSLEDFIGGDLVKFDLGQWLSDVEEHKALAIYSPHEGGYEGRYLNRLRYKGYQFLDLTARGLGDPETTLTKFHPVCPVSLFIFFFFTCHILLSLFFFNFN